MRSIRKISNGWILLLEVTKGTTVLAKGPVWKKGRRVISAAFNFEFFKNIVPMIIETTQERFNDWVGKGDISNIYLVEKIGEITGEVTGKFFFSKKFSENKLDGQSMTTVAQRIGTDMAMETFKLSTLLLCSFLMKKNILPRHKKINLTIRRFRERCKQMIEETKNNPNKESNLLKHLLELGQKKEDRLTDEQIVGKFIGLFGAGTDTTSHLVNSAIYFIKKNPDVFAKVKEEVDREFKDLSWLTIENLNKMEYMTAVLRESLRLGGPTMDVFPHMAMEDDDLCGPKIKKGTLLNIFHGLFYSMEKYFSKPNDFISERQPGDNSFANDGCKAEPYSFIPFLADSRNCVGQHLAMIEAKIIVGLFLKTFNFCVPENFHFRLTRRSVYEPLDPLLVSLQPIKSS